MHNEYYKIQNLRNNRLISEVQYSTIRHKTLNRVDVKDVGSVAGSVSGAVSIRTEVEVGGSNCDGAVECDISNCSARDSDSRLMNGASGKFTTRKNSRHFCKLKLYQEPDLVIYLVAGRLFQLLFLFAVKSRLS